MDELLRELERRAHITGAKSDWAAYLVALKRAQTADWLTLSQVSYNVALKIKKNEWVELPLHVILSAFSVILRYPYTAADPSNGHETFYISQFLLGALLKERSRTSEEKQLRVQSTLLTDALSALTNQQLNLPFGEPLAISRRLLAAIVYELQHIELICDHSVNICCCASRDALRELRLVVSNRRVCPECHGSREVFQGMTGPNENYQPCPTCNGTGRVPL